MASTKTYTDLINIVRGTIPIKEEDAKAATICNLATELFWKSYDWRESIEEYAPFWIVPGVQDYGAPTVSIPSDFAGLRSARLTRTTTIPTTVYPDLIISKDVRLTHVRNIPTQVGYSPSTKSIRVFHKPPDTMGSGEWMIAGTYKKNPPAVTPATMSTTLLFTDDRNFYAWIDVMRWASFVVTASPPGAAAAQLQIAMAAIGSVAADEGFNLGEPVIAPSEALAASSGYGSFWGLWGGSWY